MLNNFILIVLFICFLAGLSYVYIRLKEEASSRRKKDGDDLQITPEEIYQQVEDLLAAC